MNTLKITQIGNSLGVILPKDVVARLKAEKGDTLYLVPTEDGYELTPYNQEFAEQVEAAEVVAKQYKNTLRQLAK